MNSGINPKEKDYELARENTVAMNCHFLVCGIISIAYFVEFLKGDGTLLYVLATIILAMGPVVGEIICYKKQCQLYNIDNYHPHFNRQRILKIIVYRNGNQHGNNIYKRKVIIGCKHYKCI